MKKKKKWSKMIIILSVLAVLAISGIFAYFTDKTTVTNNIKMGIVDIDIKEYTINSEGQKVGWQDMQNILPGDKISKIPEIECVDGAVDCYVRAKVIISCDDPELANSNLVLTTDDLNVDSSTWYYCSQDGYFYYKQILTETSDPVALFSEVTIPTALDNKWSLHNISIDVTAEAIQSKNFTPDFSNESTEPWPGISTDDIEECIYPEHKK